MRGFSRIEYEESIGRAEMIKKEASRSNRGSGSVMVLDVRECTSKEEVKTRQRGKWSGPRRESDGATCREE